MVTTAGLYLMYPRRDLNMFFGILGRLKYVRTPVYLPMH